MKVREILFYCKNLEACQDALLEKDCLSQSIGDNTFGPCKYLIIKKPLGIILGLPEKLKEAEP